MTVRKESKRARLFTQAAFPDSHGANHPKSLSFVEAARDFTFHGQTG